MSCGRLSYPKLSTGSKLFLRTGVVARSGRRLPSSLAAKLRPCHRRRLREWNNQDDLPGGWKSSPLREPSARSLCRHIKAHTIGADKPRRPFWRSEKKSPSALSIVIARPNPTNRNEKKLSLIAERSVGQIVSC